MIQHMIQYALAHEEAIARLRAITNITGPHAAQIVAAFGPDATNAIINQIAATRITLEELKDALGTLK